MKIFNWVQRRFHHNVLKDGLARNMKKTDSIAIDTNTKALLEQVALVDVLDGWRDGILTIGTFGFDPLKSSVQHYKDFESEAEEDDDDEQQRYSDHIHYNNDDEDMNSNSDEEVNPLMFSTNFDHSSVEDVESDVDNMKYGNGNVVGVDLQIMTVDGDGVGGSTDSEIKFDLDGSNEIEGHSTKMMMRRRTTLADLFSEDSAHIKKKSISSSGELDHDQIRQSNSCKKPTKNGLSFAKKLIPQVGDDSRPIKKLNQMMRRMLKRKIHPEVEGKGNKLEGQTKSSVMDVVAGKEHDVADSVSLLRTQDTVAV